MPIGDSLKPGRGNVAKAVDQLVRQGALSLDEIVDELQSDIDEEELRTIVDDAWRRAAMHPLARPTALDRLQRAFDQLEEEGILARHYVDAGRSEAEQLVQAEIQAARARGRSIVGYCFWDRHLYEMMADGQLGFCFGPGTVPRTYAALWNGQAEIAHRLVEALSAHGFEVEWSGQPADVVRVVGVDWSGARNESGEPELLVGPQEVPSGDLDRSVGPEVVNIFVSGSKAHALIASIAQAQGRPMYGDESAAQHKPAAVDVELADGRLLDFVASETRWDAQGLIRARNLAADCSLLVAIAPNVGEVSSDQWSSFVPEQRVLVVEEDRHVPSFEGSPVVAVDLATGQGTEDLIRALRGSAAERSPFWSLSQGLVPDPATRVVYDADTKCINLTLLLVGRASERALARIWDRTKTEGAERVTSEDEGVPTFSYLPIELEEIRGFKTFFHLYALRDDPRLEDALVHLAKHAHGILVAHAPGEGLSGNLALVANTCSKRAPRLPVVALADPPVVKAWTQTVGTEPQSMGTLEDDRIDAALEALAKLALMELKNHKS